ncbi:LCP family protein [Deinococcus sp.]|uniref:LCP family protein n=1 Tax=Deinococcus sp. TaxID=47478 RepID=UPI0025C62EC0|nr:LCP family protein [Deinococcus sp.]
MQVFGLSLASLSLAGLGVTQLSGPSGAAPTLVPGSAPQFTVLLAGRDIIYCYYHLPCKNQDQRTGLLQTPNTDTLMLVKVSGESVNVLNIPRDTTVGDYDYDKPPADQKINSKYWSGGPTALTQGVEEITGERIDSYVIVRADYVARVIDALGGLDVNVPQPGIEWIDKAAGVNLKLSPGNHHLGGEDAVLFLRVRKGFGDDYGRIDHQKQALTQLAARLKSPRGLAAMPTILGGIGNGVETNVDPNLLTSLLPHLSTMKLRFATLPTNTIRHSFNLAVDREKLTQVWTAGSADGIAGSAAVVPVPGGSAPSDLSTSPVTSADLQVTIHDASGAGLGAPLAQALGALGYRNVRVKTADSSNDSSQVFTQDNVRGAEQLADALGLPRLQGERFPVNSGEVGILLGADAMHNLGALKAAYPAAQLPTTQTNSENK